MNLQGHVGDRLGAVGLGSECWRVTFGGIIIRKMHGLAFDQHNTIRNCFCILDGFSYASLNPLCIHSTIPPPLTIKSRLQSQRILCILLLAANAIRATLHSVTRRFGRLTNTRRRAADGLPKSLPQSSNPIADPLPNGALFGVLPSLAHLG
jgi:hypothetical protein